MAHPVAPAPSSRTGALQIGAGTALAAAVAAVCARLLWPVLSTGEQRYADIIGGRLAILDAYKTGDFVAGFAFLAIFALLLGPAIWAVGRGIERLPRSEAGEAAQRWGIATLGVLVVLHLTAEALVGSDPLPLLFSSVAVLVAVLGAHTAWNGANAAAALRSSAAAVLFTGFCLFGLVAIARAKIGPLHLEGLARVVRSSPRTIWLLLLVMGLSIALLAVRGWISERRLRSLVLWAQVPLPAAFLAPLHQSFLDGEAEFTAQATRLPRVAVGLLVAALVLFQFRRALRWKEVGHGRGRWDEVVALPSIAAIAVLVALVPAAVSSFARGDDFHVGETLIQWQQLVAAGEAYGDVRYIPGMIGVVEGWVNAVVFAGTMATYPLAVRLVTTAACVAIALLAARVVGPRWGLLVALFIAVATPNRLFPVLLALLLLVQPEVNGRPLRWVLLWGWVSLCIVLVMPSTGTAFLLGTAPLAVWTAARIRRRDLPRSRPTAVALVAASAVAGIGAVVLLLPAILTVLRFVAEASGSNVSAYGLPFSAAGLDPGAVPELWGVETRRVLLQASRAAAWVVGVPALTAILLVGRRESRLVDIRGAPTPLCQLTLGTMGFLIAVVPYAWGRFDTSGISRAGRVSGVVLVLLVPLAALLLRDRRPSRGFLVALAAGGVFLAMYYTASPIVVIEQALERPSLPSEADFVRTSAHGLDAVGDTFLRPEQVEELQALRRLRDDLLTDGETYFDFANRAALYTALGLRHPTPYPSEYYAASHEQQAVVLDALRAQPPPFALVGPPFRPDRLLTPAIRSYRVYRWFLEEGYEHVEREGLSLLVRPDRRSELPGTPPGGAAQRRPVEAWNRLAGLMVPEDLAGIPAAWGRSFDPMAERFEEVAGLAVLERADDAGGSPSASFDLPPPGAERADFLLVEISCDEDEVGPSVAHLHMGTERPLRFLAGAGTHLIPLGIAPSWLRSPWPETLDIEVDAGSSCRAMRFERPRLLRLVQ